MMNIWISGASTGIGKALVAQAVAGGFQVIATSRNRENLDSLSGAVNSPNLKTAVCDVSSSGSVESFFETVMNGEAPSILINCAGVTTFKEAVNTSIEEVDAIIKTNLLGSVYTIQAVLPSMIKRGSGTILNISSIASRDVLKASSIYSASKAGLLQYSRVVREEVRQHNIKVIDVLPGATETPIWHEKVREKYRERMMQPESLAKFIVGFLKDDTNIVPEEIIFKPVTGNL